MSDNVAVPARSRSVSLGRRALNNSLLRFLATGGLSAALDTALLWVLHTMLHLALPPATLLSVMAAFFANFALNKFWSFSSHGFTTRQLVRYTILAGGNWAFTTLSVWALNELGLHFIVAKLITLAVASGGNYVGYRLWVFREQRG
ncbi:GtrA family protein [Dactylosporangium sp. NPDC051485]|uniref:GtrA family protein n=1 Tax=Dactylosporangium sp. NPDC051485 TaxID=3154846 RepID=UPI003425789B